MRKILMLVCLMAGFIAPVELVRLAFADSAEVLPKGIFSPSVTGSFYLPVTKRFDHDGHEEDIAIDFNANLNANIFPSLGLVEKGFGLPAGSATVGRSVVSFEEQFYDLIFEMFYGLTDNVTVGIRIPYLWNKNTVDASLDTKNATVGINPFFGSPRDPFKGAPIIPFFVHNPATGKLIPTGAKPLTAAQIKSLLGPGLDVNGDGKIDIPGFKYKPFETWSGSGVSDVEIGARYQFYKNDNWRFALTGGARFPTGNVDDIDNLVDVGYGLGDYALLFRLNSDFIGIKDFVFNTTFRYDLLLPDSIEKRVPSSVDKPITLNREVVDRDLGDVVELEGTGTYELFSGFNISLLYRYAFKMADEVSGSKNFNYRSLEDLTNSTYQMIKPGISYSTIPLFKAKEFPLPLTVTFSYSNVFAGSNRFLKQEFFTLSLTGYF